MYIFLSSHLQNGINYIWFFFILHSDVYISCEMKRLRIGIRFLIRLDPDSFQLKSDSEKPATDLKYRTIDLFSKKSVGELKNKVRISILWKKKKSNIERESKDFLSSRIQILFFQFKIRVFFSRVGSGSDQSLHPARQHWRNGL